MMNLGASGSGLVNGERERTPALFADVGPASKLSKRLGTAAILSFCMFVVIFYLSSFAEAIGVFEALLSA